MGAHWRRMLVYGGLLAAGAVALQLLDDQRLARSYPGEFGLFLLAAGFLALGVFLGVRVFARPAAPAFDGNPRVQAAIGISPRELEVLHALAAGGSNKEIAQALGVSPNTVKTHVARLYAKLEAGRRTEAVGKARALGLLP